MLGGPLGQAGEGGDHPVADERERGPHLELLDVLGEVARRHPGVDPLVAGQGRELLDAGLHVVAGDPLPGLDARQVDLVDHRHVVVDHVERQVEAEVVLGPQHRHPQLPLEHHLVLRRPDVGHRPAGVAGGQDVGEVGAGHRRQSPTCSTPAG